MEIEGNERIARIMFISFVLFYFSIDFYEGRGGEPLPCIDFSRKMI